MQAAILAVTDIAAVDRVAWATTTVAAVARTDLPPAAPGDTVSAVGDRMRQAGFEAVAVVDEDRVVGVVTSRDLSNVEVLLDRLAADGAERAGGQESR